MKILKYTSLVIFTLLFVGYLLLQNHTVQNRLFENTVKELFKADEIFMSDALSVAVCGSRAPLPSPNRAETCLLVQAGSSKFIFDLGEGSAANLQNWQVDYSDLEAVILSHLHSDHISDVPEVQFQTWLGGRKEPLTVLGPIGTKSTIQGFTSAYELDAYYRSEHHGPELLPIEAYGYVVTEFDGDSEVIFQNEDTKVTAFKVDHFPVDPSYGFKVEFKDRSIVISGDTIALDVVVEYSKGVDVLFHDALAKPLIDRMIKVSDELENNVISKVLFDIKNYHADTIEVAEIAKKSEVDLLVFYHLIPAPRNQTSEQMFLRGVDEIFTNYHVSEDGTLVSLPAGSEEILIDLID
ncbi:MAG: MBL fold metallo-hydrolase [Gammaproteobacteria bacterium TMED112]|nr:MAG: MBL fold metallo-hydrolase [Gammaproteobacteria bacterium TMED112]|tara:strand:- start:11961 stop:13016 length:1056 start_codon:yes stop_codon:yes gene_type:complete